MASSGSFPSSDDTSGIPSAMETMKPMSARISELNESRTELLKRIQSLKQDVQNWRSKLDTQVKIYRDELSELKQSLNEEVEQLRNEFQDLRTNLQQQQDDVTSSLKNIGVQDSSKDYQVAQDQKVDKDSNHDEVTATNGENIKEEDIEEGESKGSPAVEDAEV